MLYLNSMHKQFLKILSVILWLLVIILLSSIPGKDYPEEVFDYSIFAHLAEYFVLGFLLARAFGKYSFKKLIFIIILCLLFGIFDEFYQSYVPFRDTSILDWVFDMIGVMLGIIGYYYEK